MICSKVRNFNNSSLQAVVEFDEDRFFNNLSTWIIVKYSQIAGIRITLQIVMESGLEHSFKSACIT